MGISLASRRDPEGMLSADFMKDPKTLSKRVLRWELGGAPARRMDALAVEEPLEIQVDTRSIVVTMRTPGHDEELAAGFLLGEGIVRRREDILKIAPHGRNRQGNVLGVFLAPGTEVDFARLTRHVYASSSCGLCGKASIEAVHQRFKPVKSKLVVRSTVLLELPAKLRAGQAAFERTGGLHAAAIFDSRGQLIVLREDVGRHNAVDKVLGYGLRQELLPFDRHILLVSGRASFEIVQKALSAGLPIVAAVSAPSSLAVQFAAESGQTLVGFLRETKLNVYSHPARIRFD